jgi:putative ABC transport system permease protein
MTLERLARRFPTVLLARRNLSRARARSLLATLGIVIGVVAISSLGMFGLAFQESQLQRASELTTTAVVTPGADAEFDRLSTDQVATIDRESGDAAVYAMRTSRGTVTRLKQSTQASVKGLENPDRLFEAREGRIPDSWRSGVVVGANLAEDLDVHAGESVTVDGTSYRVRAVLEETRMFGLVNQPNEAVFLPPSQFGYEGYDRVAVQEDSPAEIQATSDRLDATLNNRKERFDVRDFRSSVERFMEQMSMIKRFLLGVGGVSLLVAGVSILNVMLMSAVERREEIGVLRAVGYHRLDVLRLMLGEATLLGVIGAVVGSVLSVGLGMALNAVLLGDPTAFPPGAFAYVGLGFAFGVGAAVLSGIYPAWKASNARPVEALRD